MELYKASKSKEWWFMWAFSLSLLWAVLLIIIIKVWGKDIGSAIGAYPAAGIFLALSILWTIVILDLLPVIDLREK